MLLFPVGLIVLPGLLVLAAVLMTRPNAKAELVAAGFGLAGCFAVIAALNTRRAPCPPSGIVPFGDGEFRSCFDSVLFRVDLWAGASAVAFAASAVAAGVVWGRRRRMRQRQGGWDVGGFEGG